MPDSPPLSCPEAYLLPRCLRSVLQAAPTQVSVDLVHLHKAAWTWIADLCVCQIPQENRPVRPGLST
eukprot:CAMPEP_0174343592 /NCGR_PEP_ID=MMETSP0810-20121108/27076_1 /TAXON_ID=73025 ORGANISM="Eutreptiella gymnastica-like, Strain CCMP1594" /NCGR_SAMPLE_ID=MMETSP0810 /ASSEMBLY_ACC=CAM_ASM_000659 /LENGTH=66 /DNA_ID=CAMNT_0015466403 /DNA_START=286 /DNA_END=486 /DNA_ORIENTATION=-